MIFPNIDLPDCLVELVTNDCGIYSLCDYNDDEVVVECDDELFACEQDETCIQCLDDAEDESDCSADLTATCHGQANMQCCMYGDSCGTNALLLEYTSECCCFEEYCSGMYRWRQKVNDGERGREVPTVTPTVSLHHDCYYI